MQLHLKEPGTAPENYTISVLNFVQQFYARGVAVSSGFILTDVVGNVLKIVGSKDAIVSEDRKVAACDCLSAMLKDLQCKVAKIPEVPNLASEFFRLPTLRPSLRN
jgi:hypothetical protein